MNTPVIKNHIAGDFVASEKRFEDINPVDGSLVAMVAEADCEMVDNAVRAGREALKGEWGSASPQERAPIQIGSSEAILGHPLRSVVNAARLAATSGFELEPGWLILAGAATAAEALGPGVHARAVVEKLDMAGLKVRD